MCTDLQSVHVFVNVLYGEIGKSCYSGHYDRAFKTSVLGRGGGGGIKVNGFTLYPSSVLSHIPYTTSHFTAVQRTP